MHPSQAKARKMIAGRSTDQLVSDYVTALSQFRDAAGGEDAEPVGMVCGWIESELFERLPVAECEALLDSLLDEFIPESV